MARILLAEDDKSMLNFLVIALGRAGHDVVSRTNGSEALSVLKEDATFDLLLTDIVIPGIDGIELAQKATDLHPEMKIMFITGFAAMIMERHKDMKEQEQPQVLSKPFHLNDLVQQVEDVLAS
tara:strand:+ start:10203 stop:10571 length:369 start_codon:yes stop_codon:yes gene_type:complete